MGARQIVRVAGILLSSHHGRPVAHEALLAKPPGHHLLKLVFRRGHSLTRPPCELLEGAVLDAVEPRGRGVVACHRLLVPGRLEALHQIA